MGLRFFVPVPEGFGVCYAAVAYGLFSESTSCWAWVMVAS